jgi:DNA excision repair protein ERCC-3
MYYSSKRQGFLIDQGYAFKVITELHGIDTMPNLVFPTKSQQISLLEEVLNTGDNAWETQDHYMRMNQGRHQRRPAGDQPQLGPPPGGVAPAHRFTAPLEYLSGGQHLSYTERNKSVKWVEVCMWNVYRVELTNRSKELAREERQNKRDRAGGNAQGGVVSQMIKKRRVEMKRAQQG